MVDHLFLLAVGALGWGLSLATYRALAGYCGWPMGAVHAEAPIAPIVLGAFAAITALVFAIERGGPHGGWIILLFGLAFGIFWSGFLRVGAQTALLLAPLAAITLLLSRVLWAAG